jgi:hypothetical protein
MNPIKALTILAMLAGAAACALAETIVLDASKDNTLYEDPNGAISNGEGPFFYVGKTGIDAGERLRRGLIAFDLSVIPADAEITDASLSLHLSKSGPAPGPIGITLSPVVLDWGEGASNAGTPGGNGAAAQTGDATWVFNFFNTSSWTAPGGDFSPAISATTVLGAIDQTYTWSGVGMISDVQGWVANPASNFGWVIRGDEAASASAQRFHSRENTENAPQLSITYTPVPEASTRVLCLTALTFAVCVNWQRRRRA